MEMSNPAPRASTRVLIVDDEENQRSGLASMISGWGFCAETAADGQEALEKLSTFPAHVLLTDLMMPRMDGSELLRRLGAQGSRIPAIVITAFGNIIWVLSGSWRSRSSRGRFGFCSSGRPRKAVWRRKPSGCNGS
jgi:response regulator RpfG family c-di-GMP phosphodiesterase